MKIVASGLGRAGRALIEEAGKQGEEIVCAICRDESVNAGLLVGEVAKFPLFSNQPVIPISKISDCNIEADVLIDFSNQSFTKELFDLARERSWGIVVCTTDHDFKQLEIMKACASTGEIGMVYAPNLTLGVNLLLEFTRKLSKVLPNFDFVVVERHRADKPPISATARLIAAAAENHDVPIACVRAGGYVGVHEMTAASEYERITIVHESFSRSAFAYGALLAARFLRGKTGYYTMEDVIAELEEGV